jgi:hypothetical protein
MPFGHFASARPLLSLSQGAPMVRVSPLRGARRSYLVPRQRKKSAPNPENPIILKNLIQSNERKEKYFFHTKKKLPYGQSQCVQPPTMDRRQ